MINSSPQLPGGVSSAAVASTEDLIDYDETSIAAAWSAGWLPDPRLDFCEWADTHGVISPREGAEPGPYSSRRTPFWREPMRCLSTSHPALEVYVYKGTQLGFTKVGTLWLGYIMHHVPGPAMVVQPTIDLAKRYSRQRLDTLIEETPAIAGLVSPARKRDSRNTALSKEFKGGEVVLAGANSGKGLRSFTARFLFLDEVEAYPASADDEGDPVDLAKKRSETFGIRRKTLIGSTPKLKATSRIEPGFLATDMRRYHVPCPFCGLKQWLKFERLRWTKGQPETVRYHCEGCDAAIAEHHKTWMLDEDNGAEWKSTRDPAQGPPKANAVGFHISALYSPLGWLSWTQVVEQWEEAQGNTERLQTFKNTVLAETWEEAGEAPDWQRIYDRREAWPLEEVPWGGLFLTAGADVQRDRIEIDVWAWGRRLESWRVDHIVIPGDPGGDEIWVEVEKVLARSWHHVSGPELKIQRFAIDTGDGHFTNRIYAWADTQDRRVVMSIKGQPGYNRAQPVTGPHDVEIKHSSGRTKKKVGKLWNISVAVFKSETVRWLNLPKPTDEDLLEGKTFAGGYVHVPIGTTDEWVKQLCAERLQQSKNKQGFSKFEWVKTRERNEAFDCRVYARAAAWAEGVDTWSERRWAALEAQLPKRPPPPKPPTSAALPAAAAPAEDVAVAEDLAPHDPETGEIRQEPTPPATGPAGELRKKRFFRGRSGRSNFMG